MLSLSGQTENMLDISNIHNLFFCDYIDTDTVRFSPAESRHIHSVLRNGEDDFIYATDGNGIILKIRLDSVSKSGSAGHILDRWNSAPVTPEIVCCAGLPDKDHFENMVGDLAALGVTSIVPLECEHCRKGWWRSGWEKHTERCRKKMIAGIKQSLNPWLPELAAPVAVYDLPGSAGTLVLCGDAGGEAVRSLQSKIGASQKVTCVVGPPGGFTKKEAAILAARDAHFVALTGNRLRTELAAVVLCFTIKLFCE
ncbi:MAG: RsmE family RNA methyltransferase [Chitinivibrionales bacterium]|nr:RsmE family RNA methyltransferase [Chitinivibrionales bacterium]